MLKRLAVIGFLVASFGIAFATHPGSYSGYTVLGFSSDGKSIYFEKTIDSVMIKENWLVVWDGATGKPKTSQPTYRSCALMTSTFDPDATCPDEKAKQIDDKTGKRTTAEIYKKHGAIAKETLLVLDKAKSSGDTSVFAGKDVEVRLTKTAEGKLPDPMASPTPTAFFKLAVEVKNGAASWTAKSRIYAEPGEDMDNGNILRWGSLIFGDVAIAPDRHAIALTFEGKPFVVMQPKKP